MSRSPLSSIFAELFMLICARISTIINSNCSIYPWLISMVVVPTFQPLNETFTFNIASDSTMKGRYPLVVLRCRSILIKSECKTLWAINCSITTICIGDENVSNATSTKCNS